MGINAFSDMSSDEFIKQHAMDLSNFQLQHHQQLKESKRPHSPGVIRWINEHNTTTDFRMGDYKWLDTQAQCLEKDWVKQGKVGLPKNQHTCGACWAFTTVAAIETMHAI